MFKNKSFFHSISSLFWNGFGSVFLRFFGGTNGCESKKQKNQKPHETLRMRIEFEGRLVEQNLKNNKKQLKTACFFGHRFRIDFGGVWGSILEPKNLDFQYFQVRSGQVRSGQVRSGQVTSRQVRSNQIRSEQLHTRRPGPFRPGRGCPVI